MFDFSCIQSAEDFVRIMQRVCADGSRSKRRDRYQQALVRVQYLYKYRYNEPCVYTYSVRPGPVSLPF